MRGFMYDCAVVSRRIIPYYIWSYFPNSTILESIHYNHPKGVTLEIDCSPEPELNYTPFNLDQETVFKGRDWSDTEVHIAYPSVGSPEDIKYYETNSPDFFYKPIRHFNTLWFLYHTFICLPHSSIEETSYQYNFSYDNLKYHFACFNLNMRENKAVLLQSLYDLNLLENNLYSQVLPLDIEEILERSAAYGDRRYELFDFTKYNVPLKILDPPEELHNRDYFHLNHFYLSTAFQIVPETHDFLTCYTEKTFWPILSGKPFIISGAMKINFWLQKFGFKLYDNVFDYSFDFEPDPVVRKQMLATEVKRVVDKYTKEELARLLAKTAIFNTKVAYNIIINYKHIPDKVLEWIKKYEHEPHFRRTSGHPWIELNTLVEKFKKENYLDSLFNNSNNWI